jgi:hypothetical protein
MVWQRKLHKEELHESEHSACSKTVQLNRICQYKQEITTDFFFLAYFPSSKKGGCLEPLSRYY